MRLQNTAFTGKPRNRKDAHAQLKALSGKTVSFYGGLTVAYQGGRRHHTFLDQTKITYHTLSPLAIRTYLDRDNPLSCAGSMRSESLGILLAKKIESGDPTALIGLSLISLHRGLAMAGYQLLPGVKITK